MSLIFRIRRTIAKQRIKRLEYLTHIKAGKEVPNEYEKAKRLRQEYGLEGWSYPIDY